MLLCNSLHFAVGDARFVTNLKCIVTSERTAQMSIGGFVSNAVKVVSTGAKNTIKSAKNALPGGTKAKPAANPVFGPPTGPRGMGTTGNLPSRAKDVAETAAKNRGAYGKFFNANGTVKWQNAAGLAGALGLAGFVGYLVFGTLPGGSGQIREYSAGKDDQQMTMTGIANNPATWSASLVCCCLCCCCLIIMMLVLLL